MSDRGYTRDNRKSVQRIDAQGVAEFLWRKRVRKLQKTKGINKKHVRPCEGRHVEARKLRSSKSEVKARTILRAKTQKKDTTNKILCQYPI